MLRPSPSLFALLMAVTCLLLASTPVLAELQTINPSTLVVSRDYGQASVARKHKRTIFIAAQGPTRPGERLRAGMPIREQARRMMVNIDHALKSVGATTNDVARIHTYVADFQFMNAIVVGQEMRAFFKNKMPVSTFIPVDGLIWPHAQVQTDLTVVLDR